MPTFFKLLLSDLIRANKWEVETYRNKNIKKIYYLQEVHLHSKDLVRDDIVGKECPFPVHKVEKIQSRDPAKGKINFNIKRSNYSC